MKVFKRNAVIITVLVFVCVAVYLNWSYDKKTEDAAKKGAEIANTGSETVDKTTTAGGAGTISAEITDEEKQEVKTAETGLYYAEADPGSKKETALTMLEERFAAIRLQRKEARDEAQSALETVSKSEGASSETVDAALKKMAELADLSLKETEIETIIKSKGFTDCVVYLTEDSATVTVACEVSLSNAGVAQITDVIISETGLSASQLKVIELE
ncbi:MAG: SpoIIIAH-like family protein [Oscillospiraceae bacterium]|nr:SpoIIIAH-like family protein [Oscillospiraceae bacterium]